MSNDMSMISRIKNSIPEDWVASSVTDLEDLGDWGDLLLFRFLLLDLDEVDVFDPLDVIRDIRMQHQIMLPVFCFGGSEELQNEMRMSRADRFFSRDEIIAILPLFIKQYDWG